MAVLKELYREEYGSAETDEGDDGVVCIREDNANLQRRAHNIRNLCIVACNLMICDSILMETVEGNDLNKHFLMR